MKVKKYRAEVLKPFIRIGEEPTQIVEGYVSIQGISVKDGVGVPEYQYIFTSTEVMWDNTVVSGMGMTVFKPMTYTNFKILGEVEE